MKFSKNYVMELSPATIATVILRNILSYLFIIADKVLNFLTARYKFLEALRYIVVSSFLFFLRLLPSAFPSLILSEDKLKFNYQRKPTNNQNYVGASVGAVGGGGGGGGGSSSTAAAAAASASCDSGIGRALSQLLFIVNDIPVNSRKYDVVRTLAERLIDENLQDGNEALVQVNCDVLSTAFARTLSQLEAVMMEQSRGLGLGVGNGDLMNATRDPDYYYSSFTRIMRAVKYCSDVVWPRGKSREDLTASGNSAEKLAAELLWLAQKMAACLCADEAVHKWASASNLAWLSLTTEPRLQGSIVKISAFLFKQARILGKERSGESTKEQKRQTKVKMLLLWIPLLCRASMGTDSPLLSVSERAELERMLDDIIDSLEHREDQEKVLALWLHHFTYCPSSDWPNLHACYTRWYTASRKNMPKTK